MANEFIMPHNIISGEQALMKASAYFHKMGSKACIVSDPMMVKLQNVEKVVKVLNKQGIASTIYAKITGEPTDEMIAEGIALYQKENCDFLVAIGGGSPMDAMKAIGAVLSGGGEINAYMGKVVEVETPPMVAIPTTAGTGSEATQFTIITNTKDNIKMLLKGPALMPSLAIIDPVFTLSAPAMISATTGLDALCHAIESYTSRKAQPLSQSFSVSAIKRIMNYLPQVYDDGNNIKAREQMAIAALEAGIAFNNASVTIIHGMSRPIGALYHVPHGLSNAMLLEVCLSYAIAGAYDVFAKLARECGFAQGTSSDEVAAMALLENVKKLIQYCNITTLEAFGVDKTQFFLTIKKMAKDAMDSGSPQNTMRTCSQADIEQLYEQLWKSTRKD